MGSDYFRIVVNPEATKGWFLPAPVDEAGAEVDARAFARGKRYGGGSVVVTDPEGGPCRFSLGEFDYPISESKVGTVIQQLEQKVQLVPVSIRGSRKRYVIVNALRRVSCIDEHESEFDRFTKSSSRPDLAGQYKTFYRLRLRRERVPADAHLFRLAGYELALIASVQLKEAIEKIGAADCVVFDRVT